jgi:FMN phosphatase YigB (HAD superfamily)
MPDPTHLFIDFDDTLSDRDAHFGQYVQVVSTLLTHEFGARPDLWATALVREIIITTQGYIERFLNNPLAGYNDWLEYERKRIVADVFRSAEVPLPNDEDLGVLARRVQFMGIAECDAIFPGALEALEQLQNEGVVLHLASAQDSWWLEAAKIGGRLGDLFTSAYGPDLIDCAKEGVEYYKRIFHSSEVDPRQAIVLDDQEECLEWAQAAGARVIHAHMKPGKPVLSHPHVLHNFSELPALIHRMNN